MASLRERGLQELERERGEKVKQREEGIELECYFYYASSLQSDYAFKEAARV